MRAEAQDFSGLRSPYRTAASIASTAACTEACSMTQHRYFLNTERHDETPELCEPQPRNRRRRNA